MLSLIGFMVILGPLVIIHELGHFFFGKLFNVKTEAFSVGFGPVIAKKQMGETEFRFSLIPLGGYVKFFGEEVGKEMTEDEKRRSLQNQVPYKRFLIFLGGPLFNFIFAVVIYSVMFVLGEPELASVVGRVTPSSYAEKSGFKSGDQVVAVNGVEIRKYEELMTSIEANPNKSTTLKVNRKNSTGQMESVELVVIPQEQDGYSVYGESTRVGEIEGLIPYPRSLELGVSDPKSIAGLAGLQTGDNLISLNGTELKNYEEFTQAFNHAPLNQMIQLKVKRNTETKDISFTKAFDRPEEHGLFSSELFVQKPVEKSPAEKAGLLSGDRIAEINGKVIESFYSLRDQVQRAGEKGQPISMIVERKDGSKATLSVVPLGNSTMDPNLKKVMQYTIGVIPMLKSAQGVEIIDRIFNPFKLITKATSRMVELSYRNLMSIFKMFTGDVSVSQLGGPIMIAMISGDAISRGINAFLSTMALLSITLGVMNILPVPVLDGGHIALLGLEVIRRRPLTFKQMEVIQMVGLCAVLLLMVVGLRNDILRLPFFN